MMALTQPSGGKSSGNEKGNRQKFRGQHVNQMTSTTTLTLSII
jgi:hypothetical protein